MDIVVPVWNQPVATRNCLVSLIEQSPEARLVLVDNGSDRETEALLHDFAEGLGERALLMRSDTNQGFVRAANRGLLRAEAPYVALVRPCSQVGPGWLSPLLQVLAEQPGAALAVPPLRGPAAPPAVAGLPSRPCETGSLSFAALLLRRELLQRIGGFDAELDGDVWCLQDYLRRAINANATAWRTSSGQVETAQPLRFGSAERWEETLRQSSLTVRQRWGEGQRACVCFPAQASAELLRERLAVLIQGGRQGDRYHLLLPRQLYKQLQSDASFPWHDAISAEALPWFAPAAAIRRAVQRLGGSIDPVPLVAGADGLTLPGGLTAEPFAALAAQVAAAGRRYFTITEQTHA